MSELKVAIALDLGTTMIKAACLTEAGKLEHLCVQAAPEMRITDGRYESDALRYAEMAERVLRECTEQVGLALPFGLCSQRSSFLLWERNSGRPVTPLISWQDTRGEQSCTELAGHAQFVREQTGLPLTPYYLAPKLRTLLREQPALRQRLLKGECMLGTLDTYLIWRWTNGQHHVTDASMAARTLLLENRTATWSSGLCELFGIPMSLLPQIRNSEAWALPLSNGLILQASVADQSAALLANLAGAEGQALVNLGTGGFVIYTLPDNRAPPAGYLETLVWKDADRRVHRACEGTMNSLSTALAPYPVGECHVESLGSSEILCLAESGGIGAPYFRSDLGLVYSASPDFLSATERGVLLQEAIAFRVARMLKDLHQVFGMERVLLTGGLSRLECIQQGIALCSPVPVVRLEEAEAGLLGAAQLAVGRTVKMELGTKAIKMTASGGNMLSKYTLWQRWLHDLLRGEATIWRG